MFIYQKIIDLVEFFVVDKILYYIIFRLKDFFLNFDECLLVVLMVNEGIGLLICFKIFLIQDKDVDKIINVFIIIEFVDDFKCVQFFMGEDLIDMFFIGVMFDLFSKEKVYKFILMDEIENFFGFFFGLWVFNNEGVFVFWWVVYNEFIWVGIMYLGIVGGFVVQVIILVVLVSFGVFVFGFFVVVSFGVFVFGFFVFVSFGVFVFGKFFFVLVFGILFFFVVFGGFFVLGVKVLFWVIVLGIFVVLVFGFSVFGSKLVVVVFVFGVFVFGQLLVFVFGQSLLGLGLVKFFLWVMGIIVFVVFVFGQLGLGSLVVVVGKVFGSGVVLLVGGFVSFVSKGGFGFLGGVFFGFSIFGLKFVGFVFVFEVLMDIFIVFFLLVVKMDRFVFGVFFFVLGSIFKVDILSVVSVFEIKKLEGSFMFGSGFSFVLEVLVFKDEDMDRVMLVFEEKFKFVFGDFGFIMLILILVFLKFGF